MQINQNVCFKILLDLFDFPKNTAVAQRAVFFFNHSSFQSAFPYL
jgi:hypothetical protein